MRRWWIGLGGVAAMVLGVGTASACAICTPSFSCSATSLGARFCIAGNGTCAMAGACSTRERIVGGEEAGLRVQITLLEDAGGSGLAPGRVVRGAGGVSVGRQALRIARGADAGPGAEAAIVYSGQGISDGGTALFRSRTGDGFAFSRESDGRGARVHVRALAGGMPGRVLASERLEETDALVVRVPFEGRMRVLVLQVQALDAPAASQRAEEVQREMREANFGRLEDSRPPFELSVIDR